MLVKLENVYESALRFSTTIVGTRESCTYSDLNV